MTSSAFIISEVAADWQCYRPTRTSAQIDNYSVGQNGANSHVCLYLSNTLTKSNNFWQAY